MDTCDELGLDLILLVLVDTNDGFGFVLNPLVLMYTSDGLGFSLSPLVLLDTSDEFGFLSKHISFSRNCCWAWARSEPIMPHTHNRTF